MRYYKNKDRFVPSGTSILLKPYLAQWASNCAVDYIKDGIEYCGNEVYELPDFTKARTAFKRESMEAADYGTYIHTMCQYSLENDLELESPHEMTNDFMKGLWKWKEKHKVKVICMEKELVGEWYGGRLDLVCLLDGVVTIVDFKTGKGSYYDSWKYQVSGYRALWNKLVVANSMATFRGHRDKLIAYIDKRIIQTHGILKFNKEKKTKGYSTNYKCFDEYKATRPKVDGKRVNGKVETEKYTRTWTDDLRVFNDLVRLWWSTNTGVEI